MQGMTWRNASETAEQQQDWWPNCTKHEPENCRTLPKERVKKLEDWGPNHAKHERKAEGESMQSMQGMTWRNASETVEQQQDWCPNCTKHEPENCRTLPKERVKKLEGLRPKPCETRPKSQWKINERNDLEKRLRNSGTAAGLMPKLYETRARKLPNVT